MAANSKTKTEGALPTELAAAISEAETTLTKFDRFASVLRETGSAIPAALAI